MNIRTLTITDLEYIYKSGNGIKNINLELTSDKVYVFKGENGSGKTTLFDLIALREKKYKGNILLDQKPIDFRERNEIGYLPESKSLYMNYSVYDFITLCGVLSGMKKRKSKTEAYELMEKLGISNYKEWKISKLSKGNKQLVQFAGSIIHKPSVYIMDEPFSGLDDNKKRMLIQEILKLKKDSIVLMSVHENQLIKEIADAVIKIEGGMIVEESCECLHI